MSRRLCFAYSKIYRLINVICEPVFILLLEQIAPLDTIIAIIACVSQ